MMRRFPRLLMVDSLNPSLSFRKAQTLAQRFAIGFIRPEFAINDNSAGRTLMQDQRSAGLRIVLSTFVLVISMCYATTMPRPE
jgi:hypothetical protein